MADVGRGAGQRNFTTIDTAGNTQGGWVVNDQGKVEFDPNFQSISNRVVAKDMKFDDDLGTYVASGKDITQGIAAGSARYSAESVDYARDPITGEITNRELLPNVMSDFVIEQVAGNVMEAGATREDFAEWAGYEETSPGVWMIKDPVDMGNYGYGGYGGYRGGGYGYQTPSYGYGPNSYAMAYNWRIRITA